MSSNQECISVLTRLGLTVRQAEVYLAIAMLEQPIAKIMSESHQKEGCKHFGSPKISWCLIS
ncbi:MAG: hypothetical protein QXZ70_09135 [Candidatus Bathyarchaeia archaeon]